MSRGRKILDMLKALPTPDLAVNSADQFEVVPVLSQVSSSPPSIPEDVRFMADVFDSDDTYKDPHYSLDEEVYTDNYSEASSPTPRKKIKQLRSKKTQCSSHQNSVPSASNTLNTLPTSSLPEDNLLVETNSTIKSGCESASPVFRLENINRRVRPLVISDTSEDDAQCHIEEARLTKRGAVRKRGLKGETRKVRAQRKEQRNTGKEYVTKSGKIITARKSEPLGVCKMKCSLLVSDNVRETLFNEYWGMGNFDRRLSYMASLVELQVPKRRRGITEQMKQVTVIYRVYIDGRYKKVCKKFFLKIFGEKTKFIENLIKKKKESGSGIVNPDRRGRQSKSANAATVREGVKRFLALIPSYKSHYSRRDSNKNYLSPHLTISSLHEEYLKKSQGGPTASYMVFNEEFHNLNLRIKKPKVDTCSTCDKFLMQLKTVNEEQKIEVTEKLEAHKLLADQGYISKNQDKQLSKMDQARKTLTFDLQQCLPTPLLKNSVSFYKRTLWTFNLTIYDCDEGQTYCYLWHEAVAGRGANEVGSCLFEHITKRIESEVTKLTMYSDCCPGQNRNSHIAAMCWVALQESPSLEFIEHKFLIPGHTHMECDTSHSLIERRKKTFQGPIEHPHDWAQLIRQTGKNKPFSVTEMENNNFLNFSSVYKKQLKLRKVDSNGDIFQWKQVRWLRFYQNQPGVLFYKTTFGEEEFKSVRFTRRGRCSRLQVPLRYSGPVTIAVEKKRDLMDLLQFISPVFHQFYKELPTSQETYNIMPDSEDEDKC